MKKKLVALSLLGLGLLLGCNGNTDLSSQTSSSENEATSSSSEVAGSSSEVTSSSSEETSSEENLSNVESENISSEDEKESENFSEENSSESSEVQLSVKEQLLVYLTQCVETQNYTIVNEELTRYYLPNAFYCEDNYSTPYGYAEDDTGVFSYSIANDIVESVDYLKDDNDENIKGLYEYSYGNYSWIEKENYLVNSFAPVSLEGLELTRVKNSKVESYTVPFDTLSYLLTEFHLQSFVSASMSGGVVTKTLRGTCTLSLLEDGFNISFYSSAAYTTFDYAIKNIGTTEIAPITDYIANGGVQTDNLYTQVLSVFEEDKYKVTFKDGKIRYVAPNYVVNIDGDNVSGYFISPVDSMTYPFVVENNVVTIPEASDDETEVNTTNIGNYIVSKNFLSNFSLVEDKLIADSYLLLQGSAVYFSMGLVAEGNYIGYAEITADIVRDVEGNIATDECVVNLFGKEYDGNHGVLLDTTYEASYSEFGVASYSLIEDYLNSLN